jgi:hypothetical protein
MGGELITSWCGFFEFFDDLQDSIATHYRVVDFEFESGSVFQNDGAPDQTLNSLAMMAEQIHSALLLVLRAENTNVNNRRVKIAGHIHVIDGNKPGFAYFKFPANYFTNFALQQLANSFMS